jgi:hypothetical protein
MEKLAFARACLSDVRVIMVIMHVRLVESLCQAAMGWIPTQVPFARHVRGMWPCPVVSGGKCRLFLRPRGLVKSTQYWKLLDGATGCSGLSWVEEGGGSSGQVAKSCLHMSTIMRKRDVVDCYRVQFSLGW